MSESLTGVQPLFYHWITEREKAREGYVTKAPKPWTDDSIIQNYRFCNVRREDDKVTRWIRENWREPYSENEHMVLAMIVARTINWPDTLAEIGFPRVDSNGGLMDWFGTSRYAMKKRRACKDKVWTGAYLVSTNGHQMDKIDYIIDKVWIPIYKKFKEPCDGSLSAFHAALMQFDGMGSFMAAQVVADLKYTPVLNSADDWDTWAAIGPGSRRGLNRYFGRKLEGNIPEQQFLREINDLRISVQQRCGIVIHAQDVQNCLCEFDKYVRVHNGEGRPRSLYNGR